MTKYGLDFRIITTWAVEKERVPSIMQPGQMEGAWAYLFPSRLAALWLVFFPSQEYRLVYGHNIMVCMVCSLGGGL